MSIYKQCSEALADLMANPPEDHGGVFTEIDIVKKAGSSGWSTDNYKEALRHANQVAGTQYRARKLCRYGPVTLPDGSKDYARIASKIVYADAENGPEKWETPNGTFPRLMIEDDDLTRQGRRMGTNRNDLAPWDEQEIRVTKAEPVEASKNGGGPPVDTTAFEKRIRQLEAELNRVNKLVAEKDKELQRLRAGAPAPAEAAPVAAEGLDREAVKKIAEDAVEALVGEMDERLQRLEAIERKRQQVYA